MKEKDDIKKSNYAKENPIKNKQKDDMFTPEQKSYTFAEKRKYFNINRPNL